MISHRTDQDKSDEALQSRIALEDAAMFHDRT